MRRSAAVPLPAVLVIPLLIAFGTVSGDSAAAVPPTARAAQDTLVGTVRSVDYTTNTVEVVTGVGMAIRVERVRAGPEVPVMIEGRSRPLADLRRGQVVRVVYHDVDEGKVAVSLEVIPSHRPDGAP